MASLVANFKNGKLLRKRVIFTLSVSGHVMRREAAALGSALPVLGGPSGGTRPSRKADAAGTCAAHLWFEPIKTSFVVFLV